MNIAKVILYKWHHCHVQDGLLCCGKLIFPPSSFIIKIRLAGPSYITTRTSTPISCSFRIACCTILAFSEPNKPVYH